MERHPTKENMQRHLKKVVIGTTAALAVVGAGGAIAATKLTPKQESQAVVNDAADQLGVDAGDLTDALKQALKNRVDAAVEAGQLTQAQGTELKQRIESGDVPLVGLGKGRGSDHGDSGHGRRGETLQAAASYLGVTQSALLTALRGGQTMADVAKTRDKPVDGLVDALVATETKGLAQAFEDGRLTDGQRDQLVSGLESRITAMVNGTAGPRGLGGPGGHGRGFGPRADSGTSEAPSPQGTAA
jgi:hypothetical protein